NPLAFWAADRILPGLERRMAGATAAATGDAAADGGVAEEPVSEPQHDETPVSLTGHTVLVGYGRVGSVIAERILADHAGLVVIEDAEDRAQAAREGGIEVIVANGATHRALVLANIAGAANLFVAIPNGFEAG